MTKTQLIIQTIVSPLFFENTYIAHLADSSSCLIVDPGIDPQRILNALPLQELPPEAIQHILDVLEEGELQPTAILNTHGHADHTAGNGALKAIYPDVPLIIGEGDAYKLTDPVANLSAGYGMPIISPQADRVVNEPDVLEVAGIELEVLDTPGHSPGHVVFVCKGDSPWVVFGGDVLFQGGVGRTDFPDGSFEDLVQSVHEKLFTLPDDTIVLTGHGGATTIGFEKQSNPFVGQPAGYEVM